MFCKWVSPLHRRVSPSVDSLFISRRIGSTTMQIMHPSLWKYIATNKRSEMEICPLFVFSLNQRLPYAMDHQQTTSTLSSLLAGNFKCLLFPFFSTGYIPSMKVISKYIPSMKWTTLNSFSSDNRPLTTNFQRLFQSEQRTTSADFNFWSKRSHLCMNVHTVFIIYLSRILCLSFVLSSCHIPVVVAERWTILYVLCISNSCAYEHGII